MADYKTVKSIVSSWIDKGNLEENQFNKFLSYWIAFNCFYYHRTELTGDSKALKALASDPAIRATLRILQTPQEIHKLQKLRGVCPIVKVTNGIEYNFKNLESLSQIFKVLYQIRCNLFHGGKGESVKRDKEVIQAANPVLELITKTLIKQHL